MIKDMFANAVGGAVISEDDMVGKHYEVVRTEMQVKEQVSFVYGVMMYRVHYIKEIRS